MKPKNHRKLLRHKRRFQALLPLRDWTSTASTAYWLYLAGGLFFILLIIMDIVAIFSGAEKFGTVITLLKIVGALWVSGFVWETSKVIQVWWKYSIVKWAFRLLVAVAGVAATCLARYVINFVTGGLDPSFFPRATAIIAIPSAIVIWWTAALFLSFSLFLPSLLLPGILTVRDDQYMLRRYIRNSFIYRFFANKPKVYYRRQRRTSSKFSKYALRMCQGSVILGRFFSVGRLVNPCSVNQTVYLGDSHY